jgi:hypothetical protein
MLTIVDREKNIPRKVKFSTKSYVFSKILCISVGKMEAWLMNKVGTGTIKVNFKFLKNYFFIFLIKTILHLSFLLSTHSTPSSVGNTFPGIKMRSKGPAFEFKFCNFLINNSKEEVGEGGPTVNLSKSQYYS